MEKKKKALFVVSEEVLPEAIRKTMQVKELLASGKARTINDAVGMIGISRSAYYKYKDHITPFNAVDAGKIVTILLLLEHHPGVLSTVLNTIAAQKGNILTINQGIPLQGVANASISIETADLTGNLECLLDSLQNINGVIKADLITQG